MLARLELAIEAAGAQSYLVGDANTVPLLQAEHFDFRSRAGTVLLDGAANLSPDAVVWAILAQGAPVNQKVSINGFQDDSAVAVAAPLVDRVVMLNRRGRQHQENVGAMGAKGGILLFLHADARLHRDTLRRIRELVREENVIGGGSSLFYDSVEFRYRMLEKLRHLFAGLLGIYGIIGFFLRRDAFLAIGMFDENRLEEAVAASVRVRRLGKTVRLNLPVLVSARRFEKRGFVRTTILWATTVFVSVLGLRAARLEELLWPEQR